MKAVIIDDHKTVRKQVAQVITQNCPQISIAAEAGNAHDGAIAIMRHSPDIVFLDIEMPGGSGFEMLQEISVRDFSLVFVTGYDKYALQAIKASALDYILKPVKQVELINAVAKAQLSISTAAMNLKVDNMHAILSNPQRDQHRIVFPIANGHRLINPMDIIRCEADKNYTYVFLENKEKLVISKGLYLIEEMLEGYGFFRSHQSHLINSRFVKQFKKGSAGYELILTNGEDIPVSARQFTIVSEALSIRKKSA